MEAECRGKLSDLQTSITTMGSAHHIETGDTDAERGMSKGRLRVGVLEPEKHPCLVCGSATPWYAVANADHTVHTPVSWPRSLVLDNDHVDDNDSYGWLGIQEYRYFPAQGGDIPVEELA
jgi:hypothetical protein